MNGVWLRLPGSDALRSRVAHKCGPSAKFEALGYVFGDWIKYGRTAPPATVDGVEPYLAAYLQQARSVGQAWGIAVGLGIGLMIALLICVFLVIA